AVGCLLYELLGYHKPFEAETIHGVLYQVLTTDPPALRTMAPSIPAALERVVTKAMNKVPEDRYDSAQQMQSALVAIRAALSGAGQTTERLGPRWTPLPAPVLRLISHAPMRWRVGDLAQATSSYLTAISQYAVAARQAEALRREAETVIVRTRPVVLALGTGPGATRAGTSLARAESLFSTMDYPLAKIAALDAEQ